MVVVDGIDGVVGAVIVSSNVVMLGRSISVSVSVGVRVSVIVGFIVAVRGLVAGVGKKNIQFRDGGVGIGVGDGDCCRSRAVAVILNCHGCCCS